MHKCQECVCVSMRGKGQGIHCIHTEARDGLEYSLEADLFQTKVAVPEQTTPQKHPVQTGAVVHDDHTSLPRNKAISGNHHLHPKYQLQQRLKKKESECRERHNGKGYERDGKKKFN